MYNLNAPSTVLVLRMADRNWKETKQQPSLLPSLAVSGCSLVSFHFLWAILCLQAVQKCSMFWPESVQSSNPEDKGSLAQSISEEAKSEMLSAPARPKHHFCFIGPCETHLLTARAGSGCLIWSEGCGTSLHASRNL